MSKRLQLTPTGSLSTQTSTLSNPVEDKPWNTKAIDGTTLMGQVDINLFFNRIVKALLSSYNGTYKQTPDEKATEQRDTENPHIYIGLKKYNILFGDIIQNTRQGDNFVIDNTPYNRNFINNSKLYIMSIMANYKTDGSTLHNLINAEISKGLKFDLQKVVEILGMRPIKPTPVIEAPVIAAPAKPPRPGAVLNSDNMTDEQIELYIYREFAVKCSLSHQECDIDYDSYYASPDGRLASSMPDFISLVELEKTKKTDKPIRNIYVNLSEYITGTEGGQLISIGEPIDKVITALNSLYFFYKDKEKATQFYAFNTPIIFNLNKLIEISIRIRNRVRIRQKYGPIIKAEKLKNPEEQLNQYIVGYKNKLRINNIVAKP